MVKLKIEEKIVIFSGQNYNLIKTRHVCSHCKRKRYIKYLRFAECNNCLICRNSSRCRSKQFARF